MRLLFLSFLALAAAGCSTTNDQIDCPTPQSGQAAGMLGESLSQIKAAGDELGQGTENEIAEVTARLRKRHANAKNAEIVNYLVTAYCPRVNARPSLDKAAKQQALQAFSARAEAIMRSPG